MSGAKTALVAIALLTVFLAAAVCHLVGIGGADACAVSPPTSAHSIPEAVLSGGAWGLPTSSLNPAQNNELVLDSEWVALGRAKSSAVLFEDGFESGMLHWTQVVGWGTTSYRAANGSLSVYCAGDLVAAPGPYPLQCYGHMIAGPFDLSTAGDATLELDYWGDLASSSTYDPVSGYWIYHYDEVSVLLSTDGSNFSGSTKLRSTSGEWRHESLDMSRFCGESSVWIDFWWRDYPDGYEGEGIYIDNVRLSTGGLVPVPTLTFTSPSGLGSYTSSQSVPVTWTSDQAVSAGEFAVWARSATGGWYVGQFEAADGSATYSTDLPLSGVPAGFYQVILGYRPTVGSGDWVSWATSYGFVFAVDGPVTPVLDITSPTGLVNYSSTDSFTATWTADPSLGTGQFAVWVRSPDNTWYWMSPLIPATGAASYSTTVDLDATLPGGVDPGLGYQVIVAYEPIANTSLWTSWATSPAVFSVDMVPPEVTITQPSGMGSYTWAESVLATWTTGTPLAVGGEFGVWVRSADGTGWYATTLVPSDGTASYSTSMLLGSVPADLGYEVIVAYRPVAGSGAFMSWATSPGTFAVTP